MWRIKFAGNGVYPGKSGLLVVTEVNIQRMRRLPQGSGLEGWAG